MALFSGVQYSVQSEFEWKNPFKSLDDNHLSKLFVFLVQDFKQKRPLLFKSNKKGRGRKVKYKKDEMLGLYGFSTCRGNRSCRSIEDSLTDDNKALMYICNNKYPKKSTINNFKNNYDYLIDEFFKYTVNMGVDLGLVDFETVTLDSTPIEAYANKFRQLSIKQIIYLKDLIYDCSFNHKKGSTWFNLKQFFFNGNLSDDFVDEIEELYKNSNKYSRILLNIALFSDNERDRILDLLDELEANYDGKNRVSLTDPESRKMHMKDDTTKFAYLVQTACDVKNRFYYNAKSSKG